MKKESGFTFNMVLSIKKFISIALTTALLAVLFAVPAAVYAEGDVNIEAEVTPVVESDVIEVGDQFLVTFVLSDPKLFLSYQLVGEFDADKAKIVAPVYSNDINVIYNSFDNDEGTFFLVQADLSINGCENDVLCSILFEAVAEGDFSITLDKTETMVGRKGRGEDDSMFFHINVNSAQAEIINDSDGESVVIIKDPDPITPYMDLFGYDWAEREIGVMYQLGALEFVAAIPEDGDALFFPAKNITRGDFVTMLVKICDLESDFQSEPFLDIKEDSYNYKPIMTAASLNLVRGDEKGNFNPDAEITREDICTILFRTMRYMQKVRQMDNADEYLKDFKDSDKVSEYAKDAVAGMIRAKIIIGNESGLLNPKSNMTRAEAAVVLNRVAEFNRLVSGL